MAEMSRSEMQQHHYRAVREDPQYALAGMLEVEREELLSMMPISPNLEDIEDRLSDLEATIGEPGRIPRRVYDEVQQLRGEVRFLRNRINELSSRRLAPPAKAGAVADFQGVKL